jgi:hypothetical protein
VSGDLPMLRLVLHDADSVRVLRGALVSSQRMLTSSAGYHTATSQLKRSAGDVSESNRHKRQAAEYARRAALLQQFLDQLPVEPAPPAPKGE